MQRGEKDEHQSGDGSWGRRVGEEGVGHQLPTSPTPGACPLLPPGSPLLMREPGRASGWTPLNVVPVFPQIQKQKTCRVQLGALTTWRDSETVGSGEPGGQGRLQGGGRLVVGPLRRRKASMQKPLLGF